MANIKISELDELQKATDQDLLVIVDVANNETKKIQAGNLGTGGAEIPIGPTPPENPKDGDFWIDTSANGETYGDTLPIGAIVEYNGTTVPQGYEKVSDNNIIESGSNANGNWIKYNDGTMICTATKLFENVSVTNSWGSLYETEELTLGNFPQPFISTPEGINCIMITNSNSSGKGSGGFVEYIVQTTNTSWGKTAIAKPASSVAANIGLSLIAIGKWK